MFATWLKCHIIQWLTWEGANWLTHDCLKLFQPSPLTVLWHFWGHQASVQLPSSILNGKSVTVTPQNNLRFGVFMFGQSWVFISQFFLDSCYSTSWHFPINMVWVNAINTRDVLWWLSNIVQNFLAIWGNVGVCVLLYLSNEICCFSSCQSNCNCIVYLGKLLITFLTSIINLSWIVFFSIY